MEEKEIQDAVKLHYAKAARYACCRGKFELLKELHVFLPLEKRIELWDKIWQEMQEIEKEK